MVLFILMLVGVFFLFICYPVHTIMENHNSRWSNLVLALLIFFGLLFIGLWAGID